MAFTSNITASSGRTIEDAYCKATIHSADTSTVTIIIKVWETSTERQEFPSNPLSEFEKQHILNISDIDSINPIQYTYKLLENSDLYQNAVWNV